MAQFICLMSNWTLMCPTLWHWIFNLPHNYTAKLEPDFFICFYASRWVILKYGSLKGRSLFYKISNLGLGGWGWRFVGQGFCNTHKLIFEVQEKKKMKNIFIF